jgi:hypothetical protein
MTELWRHSASDSLQAKFVRLLKIRMYSSHLITWRQQRKAGLTTRKRGRKALPVDPQVKKLEYENRIQKSAPIHQ